MKPVRSTITFFLVALSFTACIQAATPFFNADEFTGLESRPDDGYAKSRLDYMLNLKDGKDINFTNCQQVEDTSENSIMSSQFFLFRMLMLNCTALKKYSNSNHTYKSFFKEHLSEDFINQLPALSVPLLSKEDKKQRTNKTIKNYEANTLVTQEKPGRFKILTKVDEFYINIMARADFDKDGFEDVLIRTEWYSREAYGKHVDLLILSKVKKVQDVTISWRYMNL